MQKLKDHWYILGTLLIVDKHQQFIGLAPINAYGLVPGGLKKSSNYEWLQKQQMIQPLNYKNEFLQII